MIQNKGKECAVRGCTTAAHCRGWCRKHYYRWKRTGEVGAADIRTTRHLSDEGRFWHYIKKTRTCWEWIGSDRGQWGHGRMYLSGGDRIGTHVYSYLLHGRTIPEGYHVDHLCRNPCCVRPDHLEAVPPAVNVQRGYEARGKAAWQQPHGSSAQYKIMGCRCNTCSQAQSAYKRKRAEAQLSEGRYAHGRRGYEIGCRCPTCCSEQSEYSRVCYARWKANL